MAWSGLYDNVGESHEAPPDEIVEDDDALDGWLLVQKRERDRDRVKSQAENTIGEKNMNADEVIIFGDGDGIDKVNSMNTPESKWTKAQRVKQLSEATERGEEGVRYEKFDDMVQKRIIDQNQ